MTELPIKPLVLGTVFLLVLTAQGGVMMFQIIPLAFMAIVILLVMRTVRNAASITREQLERNAQGIDPLAHADDHAGRDPFATASDPTPPRVAHTRTTPRHDPPAPHHQGPFL